MTQAIHSIYGESRSGNCYIAGEGFSIADIALFAYTHTAADGGFNLSKWPSISRWLSDVSDQSGVFHLKDLPV